MSDVKIFVFGECPPCEHFLFNFSREVSRDIGRDEVHALSCGLWVIGRVDRNVFLLGKGRGQGQHWVTSVIHHKTARFI